MFEIINREILVSKKILALKKDTLDVEIDTILSKSLILTICSSYEEEITNTIEKRLKFCTDNDLTQFILSIFKGSKYLSYSDLRGKILEKFGNSYTTKFENFIKSQEITDYTSLVGGRNKGSHTTKYVGTFDEVINFHQGGKQIIYAFQNTLKM